MQPYLCLRAHTHAHTRGAVSAAGFQETPKWAIKLKCDSETPIGSSLDPNQLLSSLRDSLGSNSSRSPRREPTLVCDEESRTFL